MQTTIGNVLLYNNSKHFLNLCCVSDQACGCSFSFNTCGNCLECVLFFSSCTKEKQRHRSVACSLHDRQFNRMRNCDCGWIISPVPLVLLLFSCAPLFCFIMLVVVQELGVSTNVKMLGRMHIATVLPLQVHWFAAVSGCNSGW